MATSKPRIVPTPAQLQAEWQRVRNRRWPATLDAALKNPLFSSLLHMGVVNAQLRQQRRDQAAARAHAPAINPAVSSSATPASGSTTAARPWPSRRPASTAIDLKRRAAGDADDD